jgi:hypothetical protein
MMELAYYVELLTVAFYDCLLFHLFHSHADSLLLYLTLSAKQSASTPILFLIVLETSVV